MCRSWDETYCSNPLATLNLILDLSLAIDAWSDHPFKIQLLVGGSITSAMHLNQKPSAPTRSSKTLVNRSLQRLKKNYNRSIPRNRKSFGDQGRERWGSLVLLFTGYNDFFSSWVKPFKNHNCPFYRQYFTRAEVSDLLLAE